MASAASERKNLFANLFPISYCLSIEGNLSRINLLFVQNKQASPPPDPRTKESTLENKPVTFQKAWGRVKPLCVYVCVCDVHVSQQNNNKPASASKIRGRLGDPPTGPRISSPSKPAALHADVACWVCELRTPLPCLLYGRWEKEDKRRATAGVGVVLAGAGRLAGFVCCVVRWMDVEDDVYGWVGGWDKRLPCHALPGPRSAGWRLIASGSRERARLDWLAHWLAGWVDAFTTVRLC